MKVLVLFMIAALMLSGQTAKRVQPTLQKKNSAFTYRLQPQVKVVYGYSTVLEMSQTMHVMDFEQAITSTVTMQQEVELISQQDSVVTLGIRQRDIRVQLRGIEHLGQSDSILTYPELENYQLQVVCTRQGRTLSQSILALDTADGAAKTVRQQALEQLTGGGVRMRLLIEFPSGILTPGQEWSHSFRDTVAAGIVAQQIITTMDVRYTYEGLLDTLGRRCAVVRMESTRYVLDGTVEQTGSSISLNGDGIVTGRYLIEVQSGLPLLIEMNAQLDQRMRLHEHGNTVIPMSIDVRSRTLRRL